MDSIWTGRARKAAEEPAAPTVTAVSPYLQSERKRKDKYCTGLTRTLTFSHYTHVTQLARNAWLQHYVQQYVSGAQVCLLL